MKGVPVKLGAPHFVDFGKNMEHSPDGKAYLVGHGAQKDDPTPKAHCNLSWITGPWKLVAYLKDFGEQAYFLNFPTKFISEDGLTMWLFYSGRFMLKDPWGQPIKLNPPGSGYGLVVQEIRLPAIK